MTTNLFLTSSKKNISEPWMTPVQLAEVTLPTLPRLPRTISGTRCSRRWAGRTGRGWGRRTREELTSLLLNKEPWEQGWEHNRHRAIPMILIKRMQERLFGVDITVQLNVIFPSM